MLGNLGTMLNGTAYRLRVVALAAALVVGLAVFATPQSSFAALRTDSSIVITNQADLMTPTEVGHAFVVSWHVSAEDALPQGLVTVTVNGNFGCSALVAKGTCIVIPFTTGDKVIVAKYSGSFLLNPSDTSAQNVHHMVVKSAPMSITLFSLAANSPVLYGSKVTANWTVLPVPTSGTVDVQVWKSGAWQTVCDDVDFSVGHCDITVDTFPNLEARAVFNGNANLLSSASLPAFRSVLMSTPTPTP